MESRNPALCNVHRMGECNCVLSTTLVRATLRVVRCVLCVVSCARYKCDSVMQGGMDERNPAQIFPNLSHSCDHRGFKLSVLSSCSLT